MASITRLATRLLSVPAAGQSPGLPVRNAKYLASSSGQTGRVSEVRNSKQNGVVGLRESESKGTHRSGSPALRARRRKRRSEKQEAAKPVAVTLPHAGITATQLATLISQPPARVLETAREIEAGVPANRDSLLSPALIELVADTLSSPLRVSHQAQSLGLRASVRSSISEQDWKQLAHRVPVVTIMGHVDVGKTTLLDTLRKSNVAESEKGGITQSIGAFRVSLPSLSDSSPAPAVTFIDTPGHEAFSSMRAHGAGATDVVVLVVAADDGVMPQTIEAANHARAAGVPIVVAINKCDKEGADADRARYQLLEMAGINTEQLGGDVQCLEISAKTGLNLANLIEALLLQAELLDLRAETSAPAEAVCLESQVHRQLGQIATVVLKWGQLRVGDFFVYSSLSASSGDLYGRVRSMFDSNGNPVVEAAPGDAVAISGFKSAIQPGAELLGVPNEKKAKSVSQSIITRNVQASATLDLIQDLERRAANSRSEGPSADSGEGDVASDSPLDQSPGSDTGAEGGDAASIAGRASPVAVPTVNVVIKADVQGMADAVAQCVENLGSSECPIRILNVSVGDVTDSDIMLASATRTVKGNIDEAVIVAFNTRVSHGAKTLAKRNSVDLLTHNLIYKLEEELIARKKEMIRAREKREHVLGVAGTLRVFEGGAIAGCRVQDGNLLVGKLGRVLRYPDGDGTVREPVFEGSIASIKQFAKNVRLVEKGAECGVGFDRWNGFQPGDVIECIEVEGGQITAPGKKQRR